MKRSRPVIASLIGLAAGVAGCDTVSTTAASGVGSNQLGSGLPHDVVTLLIVLSIGTFAVLIASALRHALIHRRLARVLRANARLTEDGGHRFGVVPGSGIALVAGFRRPRTYLSVDVLRVLARDELRAVLAHERHHELNHAPARLVILMGFATVLGRIQVVSTWLAGARARIEIDADAYAIAAGSTRRAIAGAILKVAPSPGSIAAFSSATDVRLRALLDEQWPASRGLMSDVGLAAGVGTTVMLICAALFRQS
jgi:Zn-dependent protease with chaperone function